MKHLCLLAFFWSIFPIQIGFADSISVRRSLSLVPALLELTKTKRILLLGEVHNQQAPRLLFNELLEQVEFDESIGTILFEAFYSDTQQDEVSAFDGYLADKREIMPNSQLEKEYLSRMGVSNDGNKKGLFGLNFFSQMRALRKLKQAKPSINICNTNVSYLKDTDQVSRNADLAMRWSRLSATTKKKLLTFSKLSEKSLSSIDDDLFREAELYERFKKCIDQNTKKVVGLYGWGHTFKNFKRDFQLGFTMRDFEPTPAAAAEVVGVFVFTTFEDEVLEEGTLNFHIRRFSDQISPTEYSLIQSSSQLLSPALFPLRDLVEYIIVGPPTAEDPLYFDVPYQK